ncbi:MAG: DMT family transporter [Candidatus Heimdallarchaeota archaeon]
MATENVIAILLGCLANSIYNIGLIFKKRGICSLPELETQTVWQNIKNFAKCKTWVFGYLLTIVQWFPLMYAIKLGSLSLVAPTMAVGFIVLILLSWLFLKEPITILEISGIGVIIVGIIALYSGPPIDPAHFNLDEMIYRFSQPKGYGFLITFAVFIVVMLIVSLGRKFTQAGALLGMASGFSYALATIFAKGAIGSLRFGTGEFWQNSVMRWEWWIFLFIMIIGYIVAFTSQQIALDRGKAIVVSPTLDIMNLFTQVTAGIIVFAEWYTVWESTLLLWQKALKVSAIIVIIFGVAMLSFFKAKSEVMNKTKTTLKKNKEDEDAPAEGTKAVSLKEEDATPLSQEVKIDIKAPPTSSKSILQKNITEKVLEINPHKQ